MIIFISFLLFIVAVDFLIKNWHQSKEVNDSINELRQEVFEEINDSKESSNKDEKIINWNELQSINKDIIAWIEIENTNINYPILQDNENLNYLRKTYKGKYSENGSIFTIDNKPFENNMTTIYGHNMKNKLMFSELVKYMNTDFFSNHKNFKIYTPKKNYIATVIDCYLEKQNEDSKEFMKLDEKLIKLCTCSYSNSFASRANERCNVIATIKEIRE